MFLQIIPYVADQFDPGAWVFDGENLSKSNIIGNASPDFSVYAFQESFDFSKQYLESNTVLGVYLFEDQQFNKSEMFSHSVIIALNGMEFDVSVNTDVGTNNSAFMLASDFYAGVSTFSYLVNTYSAPIEGQIQNSIGQSDTRPYFGTFNTDLTPAEFGDQKLDSETKLAEYSKPANLVSAVTTDLSSQINQVTSIASDVSASTTVKTSTKDRGFATQNKANTEVTYSPLLGVLVLSTQWDASTATNSPTITL